jgi:hypothetical protein
MVLMSDEWCDERAYNYDDWWQDQLAEEGAREHDALDGDYSNADTSPDADVPF